MGTSESDSVLRVGTIELGKDGVTERTREGHRSVFVPRSGIERITLARGFTSERPIAALLGAVVCLGITLFALAIVLASALRPDGGVVHAKMLVAVIFPAVMGGLCLWTLIRRGLYLRVATVRESRKLMLHGETDPAVLRDVLCLARARFGYDIDLSYLDMPPPRRSSDTSA